MKRVVTMFGVMGGLTALSAAPVAAGGALEQPGAGLVAVAEMADGAEVQFIEPVAGELIIASRFRSDGESPLRVIDVHALEATEIYEALTGVEAPEALRAAAARVARAAAQAPPDRDAPDMDEDDAAAEPEVARGWSASEFRERFCPGMTYCWLNATGNAWIQRRTRDAEGYINAVQGQVHLRIRYKVVGGWSTAASWDVVQGVTLEYDYHKPGIKRRVRVEILQATGNRYHFAARW